MNIDNAQISVASPTKKLQMQVKNSGKTGKRGEVYSYQLTDERFLEKYILESALITDRKVR